MAKTRYGFDIPPANQKIQTDTFCQNPPQIFPGNQDIPVEMISSCDVPFDLKYISLLCQSAICCMKNNHNPPAIETFPETKVYRFRR